MVYGAEDSVVAALHFASWHTSCLKYGMSVLYSLSSDAALTVNLAGPRGLECEVA
jgi:hypothetical protein